jgi:hypothetical protein
MSDEPRVDEIKHWFAERDYELIVHPVSHGGFFAPYIRFESRQGSASFTWGETAVEAAEAAQAQFEAEMARTETSQDEAAARDAIRGAGSLIAGGEQEEAQPRRDAGLEQDVTRRDDAW